MSQRRMRSLFREITATHQVQRIPLSIHDQQWGADVDVCERRGVITPLILFHALHSTDIIPYKGTVLYLACGMATQLSLLAHLNPDVYFIGIETSATLLKTAQQQLDDWQLHNVALCQADLAQLDFINNASIDGIISAMALHQLANKSVLQQTFCEIKRVLKPTAGLYLADWVRLKSAQTMQDYASHYSQQIDDKLQTNYLNSLQAAFSGADFKCATALYLATEARQYINSPVSSMIVLKSISKQTINEDSQKKIAFFYQQLSTAQLRDWKILCRSFHFAGLKTAKPDHY